MNTKQSNRAIRGERRSRSLPIALCIAAGAVALTSLAPGSSHREAPYITEIPKLDGTDFYMFRSYEEGREGFVTLVANYLPLQDAYGGPNYFTMDPQGRYEIKIDNDGDALEDLTFSFRFKNRARFLSLPVGNPGQEVDVEVPLRAIGPIGPGQNGAQNETETFWMTVVEGNGQNTVSTQVRNLANNATAFPKPLDNIGEKTIPDYAAYADSFVYDILLPGGSIGRMFVGQRKDPFVVNLGETFDLVNTNPLGPVDGETDDLADKNITSLILELPIDFVTGGNQANIGGWTTAMLPRTRVLSDTPSYALPALETGPFVQVSRLGMPLVNEVVIGLSDKDKFNASHPVDDGQFFDYVTNPTFPELLQVLFGVQAPDLFPRADLVAAFATGLTGLNETGGVGEMLRLNTGIPPTAAMDQSNLGVLGGDLAGFPNGRRPGDDVVDLTIRVAMGALLDATVAPDGQLPYTDGAVVDSTFFDESFPYLRDPLPGATN